MNNEQFRPTVEFLRSQGLSPSIIPRFFSKLTITHCCWLWRGYVRPDHYGRIWGGIGDRMFLVHRVSWVIHFGEIPSELDVLHDCPCGDTENCVNPAHLWVGTHQENMQDMMEKGHYSHPFGEEHPNSVFTEEDIITIREMFASGIKQTHIANELHRPISSIHNIVRRKIWTHLL